MPETFVKLHNPPIVEAVLDIECDLPPSFDISKLESRAKKEFEKKYPKFEKQFIQQHEIRKEADDEVPKVSPGGISIQALQFFKNDRKQLVQLRNNGFSFNRLAPYTTLDDYLPQIKSAWNTYIEIVSPIQVRMIRLRYVNRFLLPFEGKSMRLEEYFKNSPQLPDEKNLVFLSFVNQYSAVERETGHQVISLLTTQPPENSELPIIFDNSGIAHVNMEPQNWKEIRAKILQLRDLKNNIFWNTLTEKCLNQFQQQ